MRDGWHRVTKAHPCPLCGKPDWCMYHDEGNAVICPRTPDGYYRDLGDSGYLHYLGDPPKGRRHPVVRTTTNGREMDKFPDELPDMSAEATECELRMTPKYRQLLAIRLGVTKQSLERLEVGISDKRGWTFPMQGFDRVIGISIRGWADGRKWCVPGSKNGLFVPQGLAGTGWLLICEGASDTAALLGLGYDVIGRQGCASYFHFVIPFADGRDVAIIADNDGPGQDGARKLADKLWRYTTQIKIVTPLYSNDARQWVNSGASRKSIDAVIAAASTWSI